MSLTREQEQVAHQVQEALRNAGEIGKRLRVHPHGIRRETPDGALEYWWVPVLIDPGIDKMYRVYEAMSDAEESFESAGGVAGVTGIFLVPAVSQEHQTSTNG